MVNLYDVVLVAADSGRALSIVANSVGMAEAIKVQTGLNEPSNSQLWRAVVVPTGSHLPAGSDSKAGPIVKTFDVVGVDPRGYIRLAVGNGLSLESAVARSAGYNAGAGHLVATVMPGDTMVDVVSLDDDGKFYCVLNASEPLSQALKIMADYQNSGDDYKAALAPAGIHEPESLGICDAPESDRDTDTDDSHKLEAIDADELRERETTTGPHAAIEVFLIQYTVIDRRVWWATSVSDDEAGDIFDALKAKGTDPQIYRKLIYARDLACELPDSEADDELEADEIHDRRILVTRKNGSKFLAKGIWTQDQAEEWVRTWKQPESVATVEIVVDADASADQDAADDDADSRDAVTPEPRNVRVVVMHGSGQMDIVSGPLTQDEATAAAEKYENVEAVYTAHDWPSVDNRSETKDLRARYVQSAVRSQLATIHRTLPLVVDSGDIGLLALSLREVAKQVDGIRSTGSIVEVPDDWGFDDALDAEGWNNDPLKAALGLEVGPEAIA